MFNKSFSSADDRKDFAIIVRGGPGTRREDDVVIVLKPATITLFNLLYLLKALGANKVFFIDLSCQMYEGDEADFTFFG
jgi:hypothetical protein